MSEEQTPSRLPDELPAGSGSDASVPQAARIWNYSLGGKDNYAIDRAADDQYLEVLPVGSLTRRGARRGSSSCPIPAALNQPALTYESLRDGLW